MAKKIKQSGPDLFMMAEAESADIIRDLPENIFLFSHLGISPDFMEKWQGFIQSGADFAIDTETYHPSAPNEVKKGSKEIPGGLRRDCSIRLISISPKPGNHGFILDLGSPNWENTKPPSGLEILLSDLKSLCQNPKIKKWGQNLKFDILRLRYNFGWDFQNLGDTMLLSQMIWNFSDEFSGRNEDRKGKACVYHNLGAISKRLGLNISKEEQKSDWGDGSYGLGRLSLDQYKYSGNDSILLWPVIDRLMEIIDKENLNQPARIEFNFLPVLSDMEFRGLYINREIALDYLAKYEAKEKELEKIIESAFGLLPTDKQLGQILSEKSGREISSVSADNLIEFKEIPGIQEIIDKRSVFKLKSSIQDYLHWADTQGFIHSDFEQHLFNARTSSCKPNIQNIPNLQPLGLPNLRDMFSPPPGYAMLISDLSGAHARIAIEASRDKKLIEFYNEEKDLHLFTASLVAKALNIPLSFDDMQEIYQDKNHPKFKEVKRLRSIAKTVFYGSLNLQGAGGLQKTLQAEGENIDYGEAQAILDAFKSGYSGLSGYMRNQCKEANEYNLNYSKHFDFASVINGKRKKGDDSPFLNNADLRFARIYGLSGRYANHLKKRNDWRPENPPEAKGNDLVSFIWGSTEADVMKCSAVMCSKLFKEHPEWDARICNFIHDELDIYCKAEFAEIVAGHTLAIMDACMSTWIKCIPVNDKNVTPKKLIVNSYSDK